MDNFGAVRKLAREKHAEMRKRSGGDGSATALLNAARTETKAVVRSVSGENPLLDGGFGALHRPANAAPAIYLSSELAPDLAAYVEAHEYGHLWIETPTEPAVVSKASDPGAPEENSPTGIRRVEAYSPEELRERYANVFAREFLLPGSEAKRLFAEGKSAKGCQSASNFDPRSASNFDPLGPRVLTVALAPSELARVAETGRARVGT